MLTNYNLEATDIYLTEWNNYPYNEENTIIEYARDDALSAALTASSFYYLQNSNLSGAYRYRTDEYFFGLFRDNGEYSYSGLAFKAMSKLASSEILHTTGSDSLGNICLAGKNSDASNVSVIVSNPNLLSDSYTIEFKNITQSMNYQIIRIDSKNEYSVVKNGVVTPTLNTITSIVEPPFVDLISLNSFPGFDEYGINAEIIIYPNPTEDQFEIITDRKFSNSEITIFSICGQKIMSVNNSLIANMSDISNGVYVVQIKLDEFIYTKMITKNK